MIKADAANTGQPWKIRELFFFSALLLFALLFRLYCLSSYDVMSADGTGYALGGKSFVETWDFSSFGTLQPPLYSIFVGLLYVLVKDMELAARSVSVIFSTLTILPLYLFGRDLFGRSAAFIGIMLFVTLPFIHSMAGIDITEPTYTFFALSGGYVFWRGWQAEKPVVYFFAGLFLGLAYLTRPEGFIVSFAVSCCFFAASLVSIRRRGIKKSLLSLLLFWVAFFLLAFPYMYYLHESTGNWQLSGKSALNSSIIKEYRGLAANDQHLRLDANGNTRAGRGGVLELLTKEPDLFWLNVRENVKTLPKQFSSTFPVYLWPFVLIGFLVHSRQRQSLAPRLVLVSICSPMILYLLFFIQSRGFYAYLPVLLVFAGGGFAMIDVWLKRGRRKGLAGVSIALPIAIALSGYYLFLDLPRPKPPYEFSSDGGRFDDKQVGIRLRGVIPEGSLIMTRSGRIAFYSQRPMILPPQASFEEIIAYARKKNAAYIIANYQLLGVRPQLEVLYAPLLKPRSDFTPPVGIELVYKGQEPGGLPYLVYRIKS